MKTLTRVLVLTALLTGAARADVISFSDSYSPGVANSWNHSFALNRFDASLGVLNSVTFSYGGSVTSQFRLENLEARPVTLMTQAGANLVFYGPVSRSIAAYASASEAVDAFDGVVDYGGASGALIGPLTATNANTLAPLGALADLIGVGRFTIDAQAFGSPTARGDGQLAADIVTEITGWISVSYDYTPTVRDLPEPASMALVGIAVLGMGGLRRRRAAGL
ncbi:choice-of-anchor E domain-containing protein [Zoogloea sp.]|uniref:choice-of-anchor E domain-containing protein n=1 Tax=Zoogloea sp. TaxID=49181 RepID=UPI0035ADFB81